MLETESWCANNFFRNVKQAIGLYYGMRLVVQHSGNKFLEAKIINVNNIGEVAYIPRIVTSPS